MLAASRLGHAQGALPLQPGAAAPPRDGPNPVALTRSQRGPPYLGCIATAPPQGTPHLKIQLNTDNHVDGHEGLETRVNAMLEQYLGRFFPRLTRIEVFLSDSNADKGGGDDKRCALEARRENDRPIGVSHDDEDMEKAIRGACDKLKVRLDEWIQRSRGH